MAAPPICRVTRLFPVFLLLCSLTKADLESIDQNQEAIILVPRGEDPKTSKNRVIIPKAKNGQLPALPCLVSGSGIFENGQTFTKGNFHYNCRNGTAEVIACVADDMSVIQIGRTFLKDGVRHRCQLGGSATVTYEKRSTCFQNGVHYDIGDTFRNDSFQLACKEKGVAVLGCFFSNSDNEKGEGEDVILLGESRILGNRKHTCEVMDSGRVRYVVHVMGGCRSGAAGTEEEYKPGQVWLDQHIRYQCTPEGLAKVLGCVDEAGLFIELGHDILMGGTVHRCYKVNRTTYYHRFQCEDEHSLAECIHANYLPRG